MPHQSPFQIEIYPASALKELQQDKQVFAVIRHGQHNNIEIGQPTTLHIAMPTIGEEQIEVWRSNASLISGQHGQIHFQHSDTFLFGCLLLDKSGTEDIAKTTIDAYRQIHDALEATQFPALLRMWNFFPDINEECNGLERYRAFCLGRHQALDEWHFTEEQLPAASAIGSHNNGLLIYFLASRQAGIQIENPRQVSAFHYPTQYAPKSPSFSRATVKKWGKSQHLYISGTASIIGHESKHPGDAIAQLKETLTNIRAVIDQAHSLHGLPCQDISDLSAIRVYIRNSENAENILTHLKDEIGDNCKIIPVIGDVCRSELLLEIEAYFTSH